MNNPSLKRNLPSQPPFRQDIVGSFIRPEALRSARYASEKGEVSVNDLKALEDHEIVKLVEKQRNVGLQVVTDGEFRRSFWDLDFFWGFEGIEKAYLDTVRSNGRREGNETARLNGKISLNNHPFIDHYRFLEKICDYEVIAKQTIPAPAQMFAELAREENIKYTKMYYSDTKELLNDISKVYREIISLFYESGCRNIQLDDGTWSSLCNMETSENDSDTINCKAKLYTELNNSVIDDQPDDLIITTHICRGDFSKDYVDGFGLFSKYLFENEKVNAYYLEIDPGKKNDLSHLKLLKDNRMVVLGLVSPEKKETEDKELILKKIREVSQYVPLERICLSPSCGFASNENSNSITEDEQWSKMNFIKEIADQVWN